MHFWPVDEFYYVFGDWLSMVRHQLLQPIEPRQNYLSFQARRLGR